jgi:hypothetical protein
LYASHRLYFKFILVYLNLKAVVKVEGRSSLSEEKQRELKKYDATISGGFQEEIVFNYLRTSFQKNNVKNTVVINGFKDKGPSGMETAEFDFLIVSEPLQTIFHIEVKRTCSKNTADSAAKQLDRGLKVIQDKIPFPEENKWKYVRMMCFGIAGEKHSIFCSDCQSYVLGPTTDVWSEVTKTINQPVLASACLKTYLNILKFLFYEMFRQESCATTKQLIQESKKTSDAMSTTKSIIFWSKEQLNIITATKDAKRVALTSEFGTGKTILLKAKAIEILGIKDTKRKNQMNLKEVKLVKPKIVFVIFEGGATDTLLKQEYVAQFTETGATVCGISGSKGN